MVLAVLNAQIRLGFSANPAGASLVGWGFRTPKDLEQLTSKEVFGTCKSLRSPGGVLRMGHPHTTQTTVQSET